MWALAWLFWSCCKLFEAAGLPNGFSQIHMRGIRGYIYFIPSNSGDVMNIKVETISGLVVEEQFSWEIHQFPVNYDSEDPCSEAIIGPMYPSEGADLTNVHGPLTVPNRDNAFINTMLKLYGAESILGRSILLRSQKSKLTICGTISSIPVIGTAIAKFKSIVSGTIIFRQVGENTGTTIFSDLFYSNGMTITTSHKWSIISTDKIIDNCQDLSSSNNILRKSKMCTPKYQDNCHEENLYGKHGNITIGGKKGSQKQFFTDTNLPFKMILGNKILYVIISSSEGIISCAQIRVIRPKDISARFSVDAVKGYFRFQQKSPFDATILNIKLENLQSQASEWQIHNYPFQQRLTMSEDLCSSKHIGQLFNPFHKKDTKRLTAGQGTNDEYEVGDLSGKFGGFQGKNETSVTYVDFNLQLYGPNSIVGRSIMIKTTNRTLCSNIGYSGVVKTAMAVFHFPVAGIIILRQDKTDDTSDTSIYIDLFYSDGSSESRNHKWYIHNNIIEQNSIDNCRSIEDHFNPYKVDINLTYFDCTPTNPIRCELGDLEKKHGNITIGATQSSGRGKAFFTDTEISLSGPQSVVGKSITINNLNVENFRVTCTNIFRKRSTLAIVQNWTPGPIQGYIYFEQPSPLDQTVTAVNLLNLESLADKYHIYEFPINSNAKEPCAQISLGHRYNPLGATNETIPVVGSDDQFEISDLSGKYGRLINLTALTASVFLDSNLPLLGPYSVIGRSVAIHKTINNEPWVCGNLEYNLYAYGGNASPVKAMAKFNNTKLEGYIEMNQLVFTDGAHSDTTINVFINPTENNNQKIAPVQWSIHNAQSSPDSSVCSSIGPIYNPFNVTTDDVLYQTDCSFLNPLRCQVGDLTSKLGPITLGHQIITDSFLSLTGTFSVIGHLIVLYSEEKPLACAEIQIQQQE